MVGIHNIRKPIKSFVLRLRTGAYKEVDYIEEVSLVGLECQSQSFLRGMDFAFVHGLG